MGSSFPELLELRAFNLRRHCEERSDAAIQSGPNAALEMTGANVPRTFAAVCGAHGGLYLFASLAMMNMSQI